MKINKTKKFKEFKKDLPKIKKQIELVFNKKEVNKLISLKSKYISIIKLKDKEAKTKRLLDVLLLSTGNLERLITIKNDLTLIERRLMYFINNLTRCIKKEPSFIELKKQDRDVLIDISLGIFTDLEESLEYRLDVVNSSIDFLDKLDFNLKTVVKSLREHNDYQ